MLTRSCILLLELLRPCWNAGRMARSVVAKLYLRAMGVVYGPGLMVTSRPFCRRHRLARIELGARVSIRNRLAENAAGISHRTVLVANQPGARLIIGNRVGISGAVLFCSVGIQIDDYVNIGAGARIYDTDFHPVNAAARRRDDPSAIKTAPVHIREDAFIGAGAIVLKGVTVGRRAIVGAGAVVSRDVPDDTVVAGSPARVVATLAPPEGVAALEVCG